MSTSGCAGSTGTGPSSDRAATGKAKHGGSITIAQTSQPDFLDPALSYTLNGWEPMWLVYTPLLTYKRAERAEGAELIPGLAEELPNISDNGRTYELRLRPRLRFSDGSPVRASDFEHSIKRVLHLESGGSPFFLGIEGARDYLKRGRPQGDIQGIEADDGTGRIVITLEAPDGAFQNALAMNFAGIVSSDTPFKSRTADPPAGVGPYKITRSAPNRRFVLERNRLFDVEGIPNGRLDTITTEIVPSLARQAQDVIRGRLDYMQDSPPPDLMREIEARYGDRHERHVTASTYYFFLNHRVPPFDDPRVRQAVNYGVDKRALARVYAGELEPACNFLPPGMPGYRQLEPCPWGDPMGSPSPSRARALIDEAGARGADVTVWGGRLEQAPTVVQLYADMLNDIGLDATTKIIDGELYFATIGNQETRAQTGFANWFQDFPHPANFMFLLSGRSIQPRNNQNYGNVDDPELTSEIERLKLEADLGEVADDWAALDRKVVEGAHVVPYGHRKRSTFLSERMDFENCSLFHPVYGNDYSSFCLK